VRNLVLDRIRGVVYAADLNFNLASAARGLRIFLWLRERYRIISLLVSRALCSA